MHGLSSTQSSSGREGQGTLPWSAPVTGYSCLGSPAASYSAWENSNFTKSSARPWVNSLGDTTNGIFDRLSNWASISTELCRPRPAASSMNACPLARAASVISMRLGNSTDRSMAAVEPRDQP